MLVNGKSYQTIWLREDGWSIEVLDQRLLPYEFKTKILTTVYDAEEAIKLMVVRGAPLIGVTAAFGLCLALREDASNDSIEKASARLLATRPTAVNLKWAIEKMREALTAEPKATRVAKGYEVAAAIRAADIATCRAIGEHGADVIEAIYKKKGSTVNILTHCNAGWLGCVDWGTALAAIYVANLRKIPLHVYVDETRPRNQGAQLTAFELSENGIDHTVIVDNVGGHLMQHGMVDMCIVGADRVSPKGDVCNKIGTYLKALAAFDNGVPFYTALPYTTIDWSLQDAIKEIPIEQRDGREVTHIFGVAKDQSIQEVRIVPSDNTKTENYGFDVTPARLVTALITEHGIFSGAIPPQT